jgi:hypothetical protein
VSASPVLISVVIASCLLYGGVSVAADDDIRKPDQKGGTVVIPPSSIPKPGDAGNTGHTNVQIYYPPPARPRSPTAPQGSPGESKK